MSEQPTKTRRKFRGTVISNKMNKTAVVLVSRVKTHKKYNKQYSVSRKYKVHDPNNQAKLGDVVEFVECRPLSKTKRWRLL